MLVRVSMTLRPRPALPWRVLRAPHPPHTPGSHMYGDGLVPHRQMRTHASPHNSGLFPARESAGVASYHITSCVNVCPANANDVLYRIGPEQALSALVQGRACGLLATSSDLELGLLQSCFQLDDYEHLVKVYRIVERGGCAADGCSDSWILIFKERGFVAGFAFSFLR